jgi:hypothetical protein
MVVQYLRLEEQSTMHPDLEDILSVVHEYIISKQPSMLPLYRRLSEEIHKDRTRSIEEKKRLLRKILIKNLIKVPPESTATQKENALKHPNKSSDREGGKRVAFTS